MIHLHLFRKVTLSMTSFMVVLILFLCLKSPWVHATETTELDSYYLVDSVYSTYSPSTNFTIGGAIYTSRGGLAVRPTTTEQVETGLTLPFDLEVEVTADTAIVIDIMVHTNMTRTMRLDLVEADGTVKMMQNTLPAYTAKDNQVVQTLTIGNLAFNNNLNASSGFATQNIETAYNQLVVPLTSYGYAIGETVTLQAVNLYRPPWSTAHYNKYVLSAAHVTEDFSTTEPFATEVLWDAATDAYELYGAAADHEDIRYLEPGAMLLQPSLNSAGSGVLQDLVFKFPDALINENGLVDTANLKGLAYHFVNQSDVPFNGHFKLYDASGTSIANSNYMNLKTHKITRGGVEAHSNAKYFYASSNTVGYADVFVMHNFHTTSHVTPESTESFYSPTGDLPAEISPYFTFTYDNSRDFELEGPVFTNLRVLTVDPIVYPITLSSSEPVQADAVKAFMGDVVHLRAEHNDRIIESVTLNGEPMTEAQQNTLFSEAGLKHVLTGPVNINITFEGEAAHGVTFGAHTHGEITASRLTYGPGQLIRLFIKPEVGYELDTLVLNGVDVSEAVTGYHYDWLSEAVDLHVEATFTRATTFTLEPGSVSSLYNNYPGATWSHFDAINVQTTRAFTPADTPVNIGLIAEGIDHDVVEESYLVINLHSMINMWRIFQVRIGSVANNATGEYYLINRYQETVQKTGMGIITESSAPANTANATFSIQRTEGFYGQIVIPLANFSGVEAIETISVFTEVKDKSYARFNVGNIYVTRHFDPEGGLILNEEDLIWSPSPDNWSAYEVEQTASALRYVSQGDMRLETITANEFGYDSLYVSFPQNMINADGYVDLEALGVKGIAIDVLNHNPLQHSLAIRIAGADNPSFTDSTQTLWQTSISNHPAQIVYPSGLVRTRNAAFIPYDDSGYFEGSMYIPFSSTAFTNIGAHGPFPTLIQPLMRLYPGSMNNTPYQHYDFTITGVRFITDDSPYDTHQITMSQIGGSLTGDIEGMPVTNAQNNNVLHNTPVQFTVTPNRGYVIESVFYQMGDADSVVVDLDESFTFVIHVTGDVIVMAISEAQVFTITYELDAGSNHPDNPASYTVDHPTIVLEAPEREGYRFLGWQRDGVAITEIPAGSIGDLTLEATWQATGLQDGFLAWVQNHILLVVSILSVLVAGAGVAVLFMSRKAATPKGS